jgi:hypothetical protein
MKHECSNCVFFKPSTKRIDSEGGMGRCRRSPPPSGQNFPILRSTEWCGEYKEKKELTKSD